MNKKTFIMALCMVGHSGYAVESNQQPNANMNQPSSAYARTMMNQLWSDVDWMNHLRQHIENFPSTNPNADQWLTMLDQVLVMMVPVDARWEQFQGDRHLLDASQNTTNLGESFNRARLNLLNQWVRRRNWLTAPRSPQERDQYDAWQNQQYQQELQRYRQLQQPQYQYQMRKHYVMSQVPMYRYMMDQLENWNTKLPSLTDGIEDWMNQLADWNMKLPSLTNGIEDWNKPSTGGTETERQKLLDHVTKKAQEMQQVVNNFNKAKDNYQGSLEDLQKNFNDYFKHDTGLQDVVNFLNQEENKLQTFNDNHSKLWKIQGAILEQERQQKAVSENLEKTGGQSVSAAFFRNKELQGLKKETIQEEKKEKTQDLQETINTHTNTMPMQDWESTYDLPL